MSPVPAETPRYGAPWITPTEAWETYGVNRVRLGSMVARKEVRAIRWGQPGQKVSERGFLVAMGLASPWAPSPDVVTALAVAESQRANEQMRAERAKREANRHHNVYLIYDAAGELLYVGLSMSTMHRLSQHRGAKSWWSDVDTIKIRHAASRKDAERLELDLIRELDPRHNVVGKAA